MSNQIEFVSLDQLVPADHLYHKFLGIFNFGLIPGLSSLEGFSPSNFPMISTNHGKFNIAIVRNKKPLAPKTANAQFHVKITKVFQKIPFKKAE